VLLLLTIRAISKSGKSEVLNLPIRAISKSGKSEVVALSIAAIIFINKPVFLFFAFTVLFYCMLYYTSRGNGKHTIIFIHGTSQSAQVWDAVMATGLLNDYTLVTVDLPGHGQSPRSNNPQHDYTLQGMGRELAGFMHELDPGDHIVVAASLGSNIFAEALPHIQHCKGAMLMGCCTIGDDLSPADIMQPNPDAAPAFMADPDDVQVEAYIDHMIADRHNLTARQQYKATYLAADKTFRQVIGESVGRGEWSNELQHLRSSNIPLAIVYGALETVVHKHYLQNIPLNKWQDAILELDNAAHNVQIDQPQQTAALIKTFADYCFK
jgi:pimeloyl-ACP methyl ester carboxylesterase